MSFSDEARKVFAKAEFPITPPKSKNPSPSKGLLAMTKPQKSEASELLEAYTTAAKLSAEYALRNNTSTPVMHPKIFKNLLDELIRQREAEARLNGKQELIDIAAERAKNDEVYTLQAFIEDAQEYLIRVKGE